MKNTLLWRILGTLVSYMLMFTFLVCVFLFGLLRSDFRNWANLLSIPWAIGFFITKTIQAIFKNVFVIVCMDCFVIELVLFIVGLFFSANFAFVATWRLETILVTGCFCLSIIINNLQWTKHLVS